MDRQTADEVVACLVGERTLFHYYRDRYSIGLLRHLTRQGPLSVAALKQSPYAPLLQKPRIKHVLADIGGKQLDECQLARHDYDADQNASFLPSTPGVASAALNGAGNRPPAVATTSFCNSTSVVATISFTKAWGVANPA